MSGLSGNGTLVNVSAMGIDLPGLWINSKLYFCIWINSDWLIAVVLVLKIVVPLRLPQVVYDQLQLSWDVRKYSNEFLQSEAYR